MIQELNEGQVVEFVSFSFSSNNLEKICANATAVHVDDTEAIGYDSAEIKLKHPVKGTVIKRWDDYETGEHSQVKPDAQLQRILKRHGYTTDVVFVGEFDLIRQNPHLIKKDKS